MLPHKPGDPSLNSPPVNSIVLSCFIFHHSTFNFFVIIVHVIC